MTQTGKSSLIWVGPSHSRRHRLKAHSGHGVNAVSKRYRRALSGATLSSAAFNNINGSASADSIRVWAAEEEHAKRERIRDVTVMDIYDIRMEKREF